ncbi:hypothetical protein [Allobaculum sp. Allo2]|uniref:hypothetical protein n=1 Tax=Allobaculum sp. Allo2 TaxID=2853432 RepID=UPI001F61681C|nr:hypothetical protein [Allobaculum sp. Allo2]UNT93370.1 hypothetical protein KWG61_00570 [Allobaculum sp. Allo2]
MAGRRPYARLFQSAPSGSKNGDTIAISAPGYTLRLRTEDFVSLYGHLECAVLNEKEGIDEQKDEEYYAWRRIKQ